MKNSTASVTTVIADRRSDRLVGRFAPTPSGPLHIGSLVAAVGSWLDAGGGVCLLRIDDLDTTRCRPEHECAILCTLNTFSLRYPQPPLRQSSRTDIYAAALARLGEQVPLFQCDCTRRELATDGEPCCLKDCRRRSCDPTHSALRADLTSLPRLEVIDRSLGVIVFDPQQQRDVVVRRRDGVHSYQLATVIDDAEQGVTDVVRGADLVASTGWQLALQRALGLTPPRYLHLPVVVESDGSKLAKSRRSAAVESAHALRQLRQVFESLGQDSPPAEIDSASGLLSWMTPRWNPARFAGIKSVSIET
ncbi:MAG: tRNA glutamyl-Q(34) synthetase GluQRS [Gammaproteobacteria bacterium]|nr:tRNA glutamyl-Q(34) synthetase GluQRS [Gammaproteobacteria bacterium]